MDKQDVEFDICLSAGFLGFDLKIEESEQELFEMSTKTLESIQSKMMYWNMIITNELIKRGENG